MPAEQPGNDEAAKEEHLGRQEQPHPRYRRFRLMTGIRVLKMGVGSDFLRHRRHRAAENRKGPW